MAQKEKYTDDKLTDAVIRYSEAFPGKIKITELAKWASRNIPGLEEVQPHNFRGKRKIINKRTGKAEMVALEAFERIQVINRMRTGEAAVRSCELFRASKPDVFMTLPKPEQRRQILEMRGYCERLAGENRSLTRENIALAAENKALKESSEKLQDMLVQIQKRQELMEKKMSLMVNVMDVKRQKEVLYSMGVMDGGVDIEIYQKSLRQDIESAFSISKAMLPFKERPVLEEKEEEACDTGRQEIMDTILGGLEI